MHIIKDLGEELEAVTEVEALSAGKERDTLC